MPSRKLLTARAAPWGVCAAKPGSGRAAGMQQPQPAAEQQLWQAAFPGLPALQTMAWRAPLPLQGRRVLVVCNLKPAKMRDVMSYGMVGACVDLYRCGVPCPMVWHVLQAL